MQQATANYCMYRIYFITFDLETSTAIVSTLCEWPLQIWIHSALFLSQDHCKANQKKKKLAIVSVITVSSIILKSVTIEFYKPDSIEWTDLEKNW